MTILIQPPHAVSTTEVYSLIEGILQEMIASGSWYESLDVSGYEMWTDYHIMGKSQVANAINFTYSP